MSNPSPRLSFATTLLLLSITACTPGGASQSENASVAGSSDTSAGASTVSVSAACSDAMAAAAAIEDVSVADLEPAIRACETLAEWIAASDANPGALHGASPKLFVQNACASLEALANEPLCEEVGAPGS